MFEYIICFSCRGANSRSGHYTVVSQYSLAKGSLASKQRIGYVVEVYEVGVPPSLPYAVLFHCVSACIVPAQLTWLTYHSLLIKVVVSGALIKF